MVMCMWYAKMCRAGEPVEWDEMLMIRQQFDISKYDWKVEVYYAGLLLYG